MSTNMPEVADLHSWFQPMTKLEIVDAVDNGKSRARDCLHALSLAEANYHNMHYYGDLIVFFLNLFRVKTRYYNNIVSIVLKGMDWTTKKYKRILKILAAFE